MQKMVVGKVEAACGHEIKLISNLRLDWFLVTHERQKKKNYSIGFGIVVEKDNVRKKPENMSYGRLHVLAILHALGFVAILLVHELWLATCYNSTAMHELWLATCYKYTA